LAPLRKEEKDLILDLLEELRKKLINEVSGAACPLCREIIYYDDYWDNGHMPYYSIGEGKVRVGFRCPENPEEPIIVFDISLKEFGLKDMLKELEEKE
jgi:hypothetical protein